MCHWERSRRLRDPATPLLRRLAAPADAFAGPCAREGCLANQTPPRLGFGTRPGIGFLVRAFCHRKTWEQGQLQCGQSVRTTSVRWGADGDFSSCIHRLRSWCSSALASWKSATWFGGCAVRAAIAVVPSCLFAESCMTVSDGGEQHGEGFLGDQELTIRGPSAFLMGCGKRGCQSSPPQLPRDGSPDDPTAKRGRLGHQEAWRSPRRHGRSTSNTGQIRCGAERFCLVPILL